jgi:hypothetical protein
MAAFQPAVFGGIAVQFATAFERHVGPLLAERAKVNGTMIACDLMTWSEAIDDLVHLARSRGADHLAEDTEERLSRLLMSEVELADTLRTKSRATLMARPSVFWRYIWQGVTNVGG